MKVLYLTFIFLLGYINISIAQWQTIQTPTVSRLNDICVVNGNIIWAAGDLSIVRSTDGGSTWVHFYNVLPEGNYTFLSAASSDHVWINTFQNNTTRIYCTTNAGTSWTEQFINPATYIDRIHFFDLNTGILIADPVAGQTGFFITRNGGQNWYKSQASPNADILVEGCMGWLDTSLVWFVGYYQNKDRLFKLSGGLDNTWQICNFPVNYITMGLVLFKDVNTALATNGFVVLKSTDGGQNWFVHNNEALGQLPVNFILIPNTNIVLVSNSRRIRISYDFCVTWQQLYDLGSGFYFKYCYAYDSTSTFIAGYGGKVYKYDSDYIGIKKLSETVPGELGLSQNYPNPFNAITNFGLRVKDFGYVTLKVFDISGKELAVLLNENMKPGVYNIRFDGSNYPSGVYFYRMTAGDYTDTKKMIMIK